MVVDILVVSVGGTAGWRTAARELVDALGRVGASAGLVLAGPVPEVRTLALTDYVQARAAARAARSVLPRERPDAVIYCSITAALLWPTPGAIWVDALAAENRPGRHGIWQRRRERIRLAQTPLLLGWSAAAGAAVVLPVPVAPSGPMTGSRDIAAITYGANPAKKRLGRVLEAWSAARRDDERLVVAGVCDVAVPAGVDLVGRLDPVSYRALVRRSRVYLAAPVREEYGIAQLEALADGCQLVTTPAIGAYPAFDLARTLDPRLVGDDLAGSLRAALDAPRPDYAARAADLLSAFSHEAMDRVLARDVLPRLLPAWEPR